MLTLRHRSIALALLSLYSIQTLANDNIISAIKDDDKMNILIVKGYSSPSATTQYYSGDTIINIVPSGNDINKSLDQLIAENTPGFVHTNSGTSKHNSNNYHRGLSDKYTLYLLNGVPFPTTTLGSQNIPNIPMESIQLVEVIRGVQASLYGSSSLTGVINIVTKTGETTDIQLNISVGSHHSKRIAGMYADNFGKFQFMTSLEIDKSNGYDFIETSDEDFGSQNYSMNSYFAYVTEKNRLSLAVNNATSDLEVNDSNNETYVRGKAETSQDTLQLTAKYIQLFNNNLSSELTLSTAEVDLEAEDYNSTDVDHYSTNEILTQLHINSTWEYLAINMGGEFIHSEFKSNENSDNRDQSAIYFSVSGDITDYLNISGGIRNDHYSDFGDARIYSAGISLFNIASFSYKTSFTAPSYNDLYWPDSGNVNLEAEQGEILALTLTHNIDTRKAYIPLKLTLYTGSLDNKIEWAPISEGSWDWSPFNIGKVTIKGIEAYLQYNASDFIYNIAGSYSESIDESTAQQLDNVPKWSGSSSIQYNITPTIKPKFSYSYIGERGNLEAVHLLNFTITHQVAAHINVGFNINNMTDNDQQLHDGYNAEGRTYKITISTNL
ncbi:MAG: TonB-dependent receptor [Psychromonas sp.]